MLSESILIPKFDFSTYSKGIVRDVSLLDNEFQFQKNPRKSSSGGNENETNETPAGGMAGLVPMPTGTNMAGIMGMAKAKKAITTKVKRRAGQPKMDTNKAMSVMNFSSTREFMDRYTLHRGIDQNIFFTKRFFPITTFHNGHISSKIMHFRSKNMEKLGNFDHTHL